MYVVGANANKEGNLQWSTGTSNGNPKPFNEPTLTLIDPVNKYKFSYWIENPNEGIIYYRADKLGNDPQKEPKPDPVFEPEKDPYRPPVYFPPFRIPVRITPPPRIPVPVPVRPPNGRWVRMGISSRAGLWGLAAWAVFEGIKAKIDGADEEGARIWKEYRDAKREGRQPYYPPD